MTNVFDTTTADETTDTERLQIDATATEANPRAPTEPTDLTTGIQSPDIAYYKCGWCGYAHAQEHTVRAHITYADAGKHEDKNAFLDTVFVQAYDEDGNLIGDMEPPNTMSVGDITPNYFPGDVSADTTTADILRTVLENPTKSPEEVAEAVYEEAISGNIQYVEDVLERYLSTEAADGPNEPPQYTTETRVSDDEDHERARRALERAPSSTQVQKPSEQKVYDDLKPQQKVVINEFIRDPEQAMTEIEDTAGISTGYGKRIIDKYEHIVQARRRLYNEDGRAPPEPEEVLGDNTNDPTKSYEGLSPLQQRVIDHWVQDPEQTKSNLEDKADASPGYSARLFRKYGEIRDRRREAYEDGVLTDEHLNTPAFDEFIEDTDLPREEWERIPEDEQPRGTPLDAVSECTSDVVSETEAHSPMDDSGPTDDALEEDTETTSEDTLVRDTIERLSDLSTQLTRIESAFVECADAETEEISVETAKSLSTQVDDLESRVKILENTLPADRPVSDTVSTSTARGGTQLWEDDGEIAEIRLDDSEWATVVRALAHHTGSDENEVLKEIVQQV